MEAIADFQDIKTGTNLLGHITIIVKNFKKSRSKHGGWVVLL